MFVSQLYKSELDADQDHLMLSFQLHKSSSSYRLMITSYAVGRKSGIYDVDTCDNRVLVVHATSDRRVYSDHGTASSSDCMQDAEASFSFFPHSTRPRRYATH